MASPLRAVIDIGATAARLVIAEIAADKSVRTLEFLEQTVNSGKDSFTSGKLSPETIESCVSACKDFCRVIKTYQITDPSCIFAVATSAAAEASNADVFLDRIFIATGLTVTILSPAEINRLLYSSIQPLIHQKTELFRGKVLALEVGGGNTSTLGMSNSTVLFAHTYKLGSYRTHELIEGMYLPTTQFRDVIEDEIHSSIRPITDNFANSRNIKMLVIGSDARLAADQLKPEWTKQPCTSLRVSTFKRFTKQILDTPIDTLVQNFNISFPAAEALGPALLVILNIAMELQCKTFLVGHATMRDGMLQEMADGGGWNERFLQQIIHSARETGKHYNVDQAHAENVAENAKRLFDAMQPEHQMLPRYKTILTVAAMLHDIGAFISNRNHHKHSFYLIQNSDIFGLSDHDLHLTALVARYHRKSLPQKSHTDYTSLTHLDRLRVSKMAALLRVADALDRGHEQRINNPLIKLQQNTLQIATENLQNCTVEKLAVAEKSNLFRQVYGRPVILVQK